MKGQSINNKNCICFRAMSLLKTERNHRTAGWKYKVLCSFLFIMAAVSALGCVSRLGLVRSAGERELNKHQSQC